MAEKKDSVILSTSDDEQFTVEKKVAERSALIKSMMEGELSCHLLSCLEHGAGVSSTRLLALHQAKYRLHQPFKRTLHNFNPVISLVCGGKYPSWSATSPRTSSVDNDLLMDRHYPVLRADQSDLGAQEGSHIPLPNVSSSVMVKILEYCDHHKNEPLPAPDANDQDDARRKTAEIGEWDSKFIVSHILFSLLKWSHVDAPQQVDQEMLFEIILAAK